MFNVVLFEPEIPPNTGNIMRLCANTNSKLHIIEPCGFQLSDKKLMRAGLDYAARTCFQTYLDFESYLKTAPCNNRLFLCSTKATTLYSNNTFQEGDSLVFGPETRGLPNKILTSYPESQKLLIPMHKQGRSLNLATAVAIVLFEAWRQQDFN